MDTVIIVFGTAVFIFAVVKALFGFLGWLFPEADETYRTQLDSFFDLLGDHSLFELGHIVLVRFIRTVQKLFKRPIRSYIVVAVISFIVNDIVFVVTAGLLKNLGIFL